MKRRGILQVGCAKLVQKARQPVSNECYAYIQEKGKQKAYLISGIFWQPNFLLLISYIMSYGTPYAKTCNVGSANLIFSDAAGTHYGLATST